MDKLNYHHLRYFREVAHHGHLGQVAEKLNVSQSALSIQIRQLEDRLGHRFFDRVGRRLVLTEAGRIALDHADRIFGAGEELLATLQQSGVINPPLRVGALSTLSRNFQLDFLRPVLGATQHDLVLKSGNMSGLLADLQTLSLDIVLTTQLPTDGPNTAFAARRIAEQPVGLYGRAELLAHATLPDLLMNAPIILPNEGVIRAGFADLVTRLDVKPRIAAYVDDMAMVRLLAREGAGLAVAPAVVLADELANGTLHATPFDLQIVEPFYAVTIPRKFPHPALRTLMLVDDGPNRRVTTKRPR